MNIDNVVKYQGVKREPVTFQYWTGLVRCGGCSVGGEFTAKLTPKEIAELKRIAKEYGTDSEDFEEHNPKLYARMLKMAYTAFDIQMAEEAYGYYQGEEYAKIFKGKSYRQRIAYIRKDTDPDVKIEELFHLTVEIPEDL